MLNSYSDLKNSITRKNLNQPDTPPETLNEDEIYDIAFSGLLTEFSGEGIIKGNESTGKKYQYAKDNKLETSEIFKHLLDVKKIFELEKGVYNKSNNFGLDIWKESIFKDNNVHYPNEKHKFNYDGEFGFNNLMIELHLKANDEQKEFLNIIKKIAKESFIDFWVGSGWNIKINEAANSEINGWLSYINISIGARLYQTAFIKAINSAINLPSQDENKSSIDLETYYKKVKLTLYLNPWETMNNILYSNYFGGELFGNKINQQSFNKMWLNKEIIVELDNSKKKNKIFNNLENSNFVNLEVKNKLINPYLAITVYLIIMIAFIILAYWIFRIKMKKNS